MNTNCNALIKENKNIIRNFEITFERNILIFSKENLLKPEGHLDYVTQYITSVYSNLYRQINKLIIVIDQDVCTIVEKPILLNQLRDLYNIFFEYLESSLYRNDYWKINQNQEQEFFDSQYSFIEPENFHKDYILDLIERFNKFLFNIPSPKNIIDLELNLLAETWFEIGFEFANGNIYKHIKEGKTQVEIANILFKKRKIKSSSYRPWINYTLSNVENVKNIFKRTNSEEELQFVIRYCNKNQIDISEKFIEQCKESNINFNAL